MVRSFLTSCIAFLMLSGIQSAMAAEVLVVTWQGKLVSEEAFEVHLKTLVPDVKFTYLDAGRNKGKLAQGLRKVDLSKVDLVYSFGTTGTKIVQQFLKGKKPQVFNIVTAPKLSGIVDAIDKPGRNITGAQLLIDFQTQLSVLGKLKDYKKLGVWFDPREKQNAPVLKAIKAIAAAQGKEVVPIRIIPDSAQGQKMIDDGIAKANTMDALYMIASSSFSGRYAEMFKGLKPELLVMTTISSYVEHGSTIALGVEFEERGRAVAEQAAKILKGASAGDIPVSRVTPDKATLFVSRTKMRTAGLKNIDELGMMIKLHSPIAQD
ncbi:MAG: ABC transporter substrate binding protein [Methyloligellaceae bacterium]